MLGSDPLNYLPMLEYFRRYSLIAFIVLILLFFGLIFMVDGLGSMGSGSGPKMLSYKGKGFTQSQVGRQGQEYGKLFLSLFQSSNPSSYQSLVPYMSVMGVNPRGGFNPAEYHGNRLLMADLMKDYGIKPDKEQTETFIKETLFTDQNGEFAETDYLQFIEKKVKRNGLSVQDFNTLVGEIMAVSKLQETLSSGVSINEEISKKTIMLSQQEITFEQFSLPIEKLKEGIQVTEEEVKAYWDENKNNYLSDVQLKVQYVVTDAGITALEMERLEAAKKKATEEGKTEEEIKALTGDLPLDEKTNLINEAGDKIDQLFVNVQNNDGADFLIAAEELGLEVKTTEFFTAENAPFELKLPITSPPGAGTIMNQLGAITTAGATMDSLSNVFSIGEGRFLLAQVTERKDAEPLPYEEVGERAKLDLIEKRATDSIAEEVGKVREQLVSGAEGKDIKELAKELNLEYQKHENTSFRNPVAGDPTSGELFVEAIEVPDNVFSEPIIQDESLNKRAVILRPLGRRYVTSEENKAALESQLSQSSQRMGGLLFRNWFTAQRAQAEIETY